MSTVNPMVAAMLKRAGMPPENLIEAVTEFFPDKEVDNALAVAYLESAWDQWAVNDSALWRGMPGETLEFRDGVPISAELSVGYFQLNVVTLPRAWQWPKLFIPRENAGTAHMLWAERGWQPWYFTSKRLGLS